MAYLVGYVLGFFDAVKQAIWDLDLPAASGGGNDENNDLTLGVIFTVDVETDVEGIAFYMGSAAIFDRDVTLFINGNNTAVASGSGASIVAPGWTLVPLTTPYTCSVGVQYIACFDVEGDEGGDKGYWSTGAYFASDFTVSRGPFTTVSKSADTEGTGNGRYFAGAKGTYPHLYFNDNNYWVTPYASGFAPDTLIPMSEWNRNDDSLLHYLKKNAVISSGEVVGALNEFIGVTAPPRKEYAEAKRRAFGVV